MATAPVLNADFLTFKGDDVSPIFTVVDADGVAVDISEATQISWGAQLTASDAQVLTLTKTGGAITFVTDGTDGKFQVAISAAQTNALDGWYQHLATITLADKVSTIAVGRMQVGVAPTWTYNAAQIADVPLFQVRRLLGDVIANDQQILDSEILFALTQRANIYGAAADCARYIAAQYSRKVDTTSPGSIQTAYGAQARKYLDLAATLDRQSRSRGAGVMPFAGGISVSHKWEVQSNPDRVQPQFNLGMDDNFIPIPAGPNQHLGGQGDGTT